MPLPSFDALRLRTEPFDFTQDRPVEVTGFDPSTGSGQIRFDWAQRRLRDGAKTPRLLRPNGFVSIFMKR